MKIPQSLLMKWQHIAKKTMISWNVWYFLPICVSSQSLSVMYSSEVDSIRYAYCLLPFKTLSLPSSLLLVKTLGRALSMAAHIRWYVEKLDSWKNFIVDPPFTAPYLILLCLAKSSALLIVASIRSIVRKAAKLAVYEASMMRAKNHHIPVTIRVANPLYTQMKSKIYIEIMAKLFMLNLI